MSSPPAGVPHVARKRPLDISSDTPVRRRPVAPAPAPIPARAGARLSKARVSVTPHVPDKATRSAEPPSLSKDKADQRNKKPKFSNSHELVTLLIGQEPNTKKLVLHKESACLYSPVFNAAFNSDFVEGQTQEYRLEDVNEGAAQFLVQWIYNKELIITQLEDGKYDQEELGSLIQLWVFAYRLLAPCLQNLALREISKICSDTEIAPSSSFHYVYANTGPESPLRRFVVDRCASNFHPSDYGAFSERFPKAMLVDLAAFLSHAKSPIAVSRLKPEYNLARYNVPEV